MSDKPAVDVKDLENKFSAAWEYRKGYVTKNQLEAFRLINGAGDGIPNVVVEYYAGSFLITLQDKIYVPLQGKITEFLKALNKKIKEGVAPQFFWLHNFADEGMKCLISNTEVKNIKEKDLTFEIRLGEGQHTGLFLDQRDNRERVRLWAKDKKVLNLFCYSGAFTVAAFKGGAKEVHSVDLSKNYLTWLKRNLALNEIPENRSHPYTVDAFFYVTKLVEQKQKFDLVILDPPTFSRSRGKSFSTEKDLGPLVQTCTQLLGEGGKLFISINTKKLTRNDFQTLVKTAVQPYRLKILEYLALPLDFHLTKEEEKNPYLKACLVG